MRKLTDHIVSGDQSVQLSITVTDEPGAGGACHRYQIDGFNASTNPSMTDDDRDVEFDAMETLSILFQNGPIKESGVNGITQEALLAIVIDRLQSFQTGPYPSVANLNALDHCRQALYWLQYRTKERIARGVEGTREK